MPIRRFQGLKAEAVIRTRFGVFEGAFVAAIQQIKDNRLRHNRHPHIPHRKSPSHGSQTRHDTARRIEPECRTTRQDNGIDVFNRHLRFQQGRVTRAGRAAQNGNRGRGRLIKNNHADARGEAWILR